MSAIEATVYVVTNDSHMCDALRSIIESAGLRIHPSSSTRQFITTCDITLPACAIVDEQIPGMSCTTLLNELRERGANIPVVVVSNVIDVVTVVRAMKAGVVDYLHWPCDDRALLNAVEEALRHELTMRETRRFATEINFRLARLTRRERQVLDAIVTGMPNKRVATEFGISEKTVEAHRARVKEKMRATGIADLVRMTMLIGAYPQAHLIKDKKSSMGCILGSDDDQQGPVDGRSHSVMARAASLPLGQN